MSSGTQEHLEHAEHVQHAARDEFDRRVAMSMTIIAALLAVVTLLGHRTHTETVRLQAEASVFHTKASDQWSYYQAKNIRLQEYAAYLELLQVLARQPGSDARRAASQERWSKQVAKYQQELPQLEAEARALVKKGEELQAQSDRAEHQANRFDLGELGVEMALILSSIAVLTRRKGYWLGGIVFAVLGVAVTASAFLLH